MTGYLFSRGPIQDDQARGDHLGVGGSRVAKGSLFFFNGNQLNQLLEGRTAIEPKTWNHVVLVREGDKVRVHLNGHTDPEIVGTATVDPHSSSKEWFFGGRNDGFANLEGKLADVAIYDRALTPQEAARHYQAAAL